MGRKGKRTAAYFLFMGGSVFGICCAVFALPLPLRILDAGVVAVAIVLVLQTTRCPSCGKHGIPISPFAKEGPCCKKCGKQL